MSVRFEAVKHGRHPPAEPGTGRKRAAAAAIGVGSGGRLGLLAAGSLTTTVSFFHVVIERASGIPRIGVVAGAPQETESADGCDGEDHEQGGGPEHRRDTSAQGALGLFLGGSCLGPHRPMETSGLELRQCRGIHRQECSQSFELLLA